MWITRRRAKRALVEEHRPVPPWMGPLPTGPVVFDPSLRRASELVARSGRPAVPAQPAAVRRHGHAA